MFNKEDLQTFFMSILLTGVIVLALSLVACQDNAKKELLKNTEFRDALLQKIDLGKGELVSKAICTENSQSYTILTNLKAPLKVESPDKAFYTNYIFKIYLLPDKTYSGSMTRKTFETSSNTPIHEAQTQSFNGLWVENDNILVLMGLGKIRKVKLPLDTTAVEQESLEKEKTEKVGAVEPKFVDKVELMITSLAHQNRLNKKITELTSEPSSDGPEGQKLSDICAPVQ